jgi:hypothetical protein
MHRDKVHTPPRHQSPSLRFTPKHPPGKHPFHHIIHPALSRLDSLSPSPNSTPCRWCFSPSSTLCRWFLILFTQDLALIPRPVSLLPNKFSAAPKAPLCLHVYRTLHPSLVVMQVMLTTSQALTVTLQALLMWKTRPWAKSEAGMFAQPSNVSIILKCFSHPTNTNVDPDITRVGSQANGYEVHILSSFYLSN